MGEALKALLQNRLADSGKSRGEVVERLSRSNRSKAFRRLDQLLNGEPGGAAFLMQVAEVLEIPFSQIEVAMEFDLQKEDRERERLREEEKVRWFETTGPHLWVVLPKDYWPSLITVLGPEFFLLVPVPLGLLKLPDYEQFLEVGVMVRAHFGDPERRVKQVAGYRYRRSLDETFEFSTEGEFLGTREKDPGIAKAVVGFRDGGRVFRRMLGFPGVMDSGWSCRSDGAQDDAA